MEESVREPNALLGGWGLRRGEWCTESGWERDAARSEITLPFEDDAAVLALVADVGGARNTRLGCEDMEDPCMWFGKEPLEDDAALLFAETDVGGTCADNEMENSEREFGRLLHDMFRAAPAELELSNESMTSQNCSASLPTLCDTAPSYTSQAQNSDGDDWSSGLISSTPAHVTPWNHGCEVDDVFRKVELGAEPEEPAQRVLHKRPILSAVEVARQAAESAAQSCLRQKQGREAAGLSVTASDLSDSREAKKQKRLQKNRNSAFVSRIRQREYSNKLTESLAEEEKRHNELLSERSLLLERIEALKQEAIRVGSEIALRNSSLPRVLDPIAPRKEVRVTSLLLVICLFGFMIPGLQPVGKHERFLKQRLPASETDALQYCGGDAENGSWFEAGFHEVKTELTPSVAVLPHVEQANVWSFENVQNETVEETQERGIIPELEFLPGEEKPGNAAEGRMTGVHSAVENQFNFRSIRDAKIEETIVDSSNLNRRAVAWEASVSSPTMRTV